MSKARRTRPAWIRVGVILALGLLAPLKGEENVPVPPLPPPADIRFFPGSGGRFEVATASAARDEGAALATLAEQAWERWRGPLGLPDRLATGITVRLTPPEQWSVPEPAWRVGADPSGVVSLWIRGGGEAGVSRDRIRLTALAEAALLRLTILRGAPGEHRKVPAWLAVAAAEAALTANRPALLDAWRQLATRPGGVASLQAILTWMNDQPIDLQSSEIRPEYPHRVGAFALWLWLQAESTGTASWGQFTAELLRGTAPGAALIRTYPNRLARPEAAELELAWWAASAHLARMQTIPLFGAEESRLQLARLTRLVVVRLEGSSEEVMDLANAGGIDVTGYAASERDARADWLTAYFARIHPFYRNAAGSLGRVWLAQKAKDETARRQATEEWRADFAAGESLQRASTALLDVRMSENP